jgi:IS30 family transposase
MGRHAEFTAATSKPVYFCDPASPWQRGSNENTNGLLRQYFPQSSDLSVYTAEDLTAVAAELDNRSRKIPHWDTPAQRFTRLLAITLTDLPRTMHLRDPRQGCQPSPG